MRIILLFALVTVCAKYASLSPSWRSSTDVTDKTQIPRPPITSDDWDGSKPLKKDIRDFVDFWKKNAGKDDKDTQTAEVGDDNEDTGPAPKTPEVIEAANIGDNGDDTESALVDDVDVVDTEAASLDSIASRYANQVRNGFENMDNINW